MAADLILKISNPYTTPSETAVRISGNAPLKIGREATNDIIIPNPYISRHHVTLTPRDGQWLVSDMNSRNGTRYNGVPVRGEVTCTPNGSIVISDVTITFLDSSDEAAQTLLEQAPLNGTVAKDTSIAINSNLQSKLADASSAAVRGKKPGFASSEAPKKKKLVSDTHSYTVRQKRAVLGRLVFAILFILVIGCGLLLGTGLL